MRGLMGTASLRVLALLLIALAPSAVASQGTGRLPSVSPAPGTVGGAPPAAMDSTAKRAALDSTTLRKRAADSIALRSAIDSATKRAIDSAFRDFAQERSQWRLAIWGLLALGTVFLVLLVYDIVRGHDVLVESHWGGFGGGVGGTRFSRTLVLAVLLLLTGGMLTVVAVSHPGAPRRSDGERAADTLQKTPATAPARTLPSTAPTSAPLPERALPRIA
jgi:hypothetical protein